MISTFKGVSWTDVLSCLKNYAAHTAKKEAETAALAASTSLLASTPVICRNCGKKGHITINCWAEGGAAQGKAPEWYLAKGKKKKKMSDISSADANAVTTAAETYILATTVDKRGAHTISQLHATVDSYFHSRCLGFRDSVLGGGVDDTGKKTSVYSIFNKPICCSVMTNETRPSLLYSTFLNSAATKHCIPDRARFITFESLEGNEGSTAIKDGEHFKVLGCGDVKFWTHIDGKVRDVILKNTVYTPALLHNLVLLSTLDMGGHHSSWGNGKLFVYSKDKKTPILEGVIFRSTTLCKMYSVDVLDDPALWCTRGLMNDLQILKLGIIVWVMWMFVTLKRWCQKVLLTA